MCEGSRKWSRYRVRRFGIRILAAALSASLLLAGQASAAVQLGETFVPTVSCDPFTHLQVASANPSYAAPADGFITSWSIRGPASPDPVKFKVARLVGGNVFAIVAESGTHTPPAGGLLTQPIHVAVKAGDVIGLYISGAGPRDSSGWRRAAIPCGTTPATIPQVRSPPFRRRPRA